MVMRRDSSLPPEAVVERPRLVWEPTGGAPVEYEVWAERPITIGRDGSNTVVVDSPFVSKTHAVVRHSAGAYTVEDLKSANGTRVNGAPVLVSILAPGDVLEIGDQRFVFREAAAAGTASGGLGKNAKLMLTAVGTLGVFGVLFALIAPSSAPPAPATSARASGRSGSSTATAAPRRIDTRSAVVKDALDRAQQAGIKPADALFDDANAMLSAGRLREAVQLYGAVVERDAKNEAAARRLRETTAAWSDAIADHAAEAERASDELRLNDAILEWGQVLLLTDADDPAHQAADRGIERARQQLGR